MAHGQCPGGTIPGFSVGGQGFTGFGGQPSNVLEPRRIHRFAWVSVGRGLGSFSQVEMLVLKSSGRPKFKFEKVKMDHNQESAKFAGKSEWDPIEMTWYDIEQDPDTSRGIYHWLETVQHINTANVSHPRNYKRNAKLGMLNGVGQFSEQWDMAGCWPESVDWKTLDYTSSELQTVSCSMSYDRATRTCLTVGAGIMLPSCPADGAANPGGTSLIV